MPNLNNILGPRFVPANTKSRVAKCILFTNSLAPSPSPIDYVLPSTLSKSGKTFGVERSSYEKVFLKTSTHINKHSPGPIYKLSFPEGKFVTLKSRINYLDTEMARLVPGPNAYSTVSTINKEGKYMLSTYRDSGAPKYGPWKKNESLSRVKVNCLETLGPGPKYDYWSSFENNKGRTLSKYHSYGAPKIAPPYSNSAGRDLNGGIKSCTF